MDNSLLEKEVVAAQIFTGLVPKEKRGRPYLDGSVAVTKPNGDVVTRYQVTIGYPAEYPFCFPKVFEVGGRIKRTAERHIGLDGACCLAVKPEEILICRKGFRTVRFIPEILLPYLAAQHLFDCGYPEELNKGYKHYNEGIIEYYSDLFVNDDRNFILKSFDLVITNKIPIRNDLCYCGSGKKFKFCHETQINTLRNLGKKYLQDERTKFV